MRITSVNWFRRKRVCYLSCSSTPYGISVEDTTGHNFTNSHRKSDVKAKLHLLGYLYNAMPLNIGCYRNLLKAYILRLLSKTPRLEAGLSEPILVRTSDGYKFFVRPHTPDLYTVCCSEVYEIRKWFRSLARGIVVDVGAYIGTYTIRACKTSEKVIAIEPLPQNFVVLKKNIELNSCSSKVILVNKAVGFTKRVAYMYVPHIRTHYDYSRATLGAELRGLSEEFVRVPVAEDLLDNILSSLGIERVDFMKVDIEGYLIQAFPGMVESLMKTRYLFVEIPRTQLIEVHRQLKQLGFRLLDSHDMNYLYVNQRLT